jgi:hypothetical protein
MFTHLNHLTRPRSGRRSALLGLGSLIVAGLSLTAPPANAAAPVNDDWDAATAVTKLAFTSTVDTAEATRDAVNPAGAKWKAHSVWYVLQLPTKGPALITARGTDYRHFLRVFEAPSPSAAPSEWTPLNRDYGNQAYPASVLLKTKKSSTYFVLVASPNDATSGTARLTMRRPAVLTTTVAPNGTYDRVDGSALIHGTMKTTQPATVEVKVELRQLVNGVVVKDTQYPTWKATTTATAWKIRFSTNHVFKVGDARITVSRLIVVDENIRVGVYHFARHTVTLR